MATNLLVESPDFDRIRKGVPKATEDAIRLLWYALNTLSARETQDVYTTQNTFQPLVKSDAPTTAQSNYDTGGATILLFTGSTAFNFTGIRNGAPGRVVELINLGTGTVTVKHDTTSDDLNKIEMQAGADKAVPQNKAMFLRYLNSRWREVVLA